jgi:hypothetical protein
MPLKLLIFGGYGTFGGRLARLLADDRRIALLIAGRSLDKAAAFCAALPPGAERRPLALDRDGDVAGAIARLKPDLIVDASGPFQAYGADPYRVVKAAIAQGIDYVDIADGAGFVAGIGQFDAAARARGVFALSGASSVPALTAAAVRALARGMGRIATITAGIAPSPGAQAIGPNVLRAVAAYAGKKVALRRGGRPAVGHALIDSRRCSIAPPGCLPLGSRRFSLVDAPDLRVLPELWPELESVWIGAAPAPALFHGAFSALAWLVRLRLVPSLAPFAGWFHRLQGWRSWGEPRSGMFVSIVGTMPNGERRERRWDLLAENDDGPYVPAMGAAAIVRRCLKGRRPAPGARAAARDLELGDYGPFFAGRAIFTGIRECSARNGGRPLFRKVLGNACRSPPAP